VVFHFKDLQAALRTPRARTLSMQWPTVEERQGCRSLCVTVRGLYPHPASDASGLAPPPLGPPRTVTVPGPNSYPRKPLTEGNSEPGHDRYVVLPSPWRDHPKEVRRWVARSLNWAQSLPPQQPKIGPTASYPRGFEDPPGPGGCSLLVRTRRNTDRRGAGG